MRQFQMKKSASSTEFCSLDGQHNAQKPRHTSIFKLKIAHVSGCCKQDSYLAVHNHTIKSKSLVRSRVRVCCFGVLQADLKKP
jgi:hypothetical protein